MKEQTSCFSSCEYNHNCSGGFINKYPECDAEFKRIQGNLLKDDQYKEVSIVFPPPHKVGLLCKGDLNTILILIDNGFIEEPELLK